MTQVPFPVPARCVPGCAATRSSPTSKAPCTASPGPGTITSPPTTSTRSCWRYPATRSAPAGYAIGPASLPGSACWSWRRELMPSLVKTFCRWYSTVCGLRNSWAAISGLDKPDPGQPGDLGLLGVSSPSRGGGALAGGLAGGQQLAAGPFGERLHADRGEHVVRGAQLRPRVGPPALAAQPLAVQQVRAGQFGTKAGAAEPADRLAVQALGVLAVAEQRPAARVDPLPPVGLAGAGRLGQQAERAGGQPGSARSCWPPRSARAAPTWR